MPNSAPAVLITGGNGYLGQRLAGRILSSSNYSVKLYLHAATKQELSDKSRSLSTSFQEFEESGRFSVLGGELKSKAPFEDLDASRIVQIIHSAAVTRFNVEADLANEVNIEGARKVLSFARRCPKLEAVQFLSTVYASGLRTGLLKETRLEKAPQFSNHYERSKWEAEEVLFDEYAEIPANLIRIATLIADDESGAVTQQNAFHNTLKLLYYGLLSLFPGEKNTAVYFVTGNFVLDAIMRIFESKDKNQIYHLCHRQNESANLEELLDTVFAAFEKYPDFKLRRVLKPLWSDAESFELLNQGLGSMSGGVLAQSVSSVAPFAKQLFANKDFCNENLRRIMPDYKAPDPLRLIESTSRYLADSKWGRKLQDAK
ncbi:MAG: SDR family oxidoreductase [Candidatus Obscuribacterales bacterium]|nr:SDR family oxidoreductase [Candidatus Obscuribacterales bacterium]